MTFWIVIKKKGALLMGSRLLSLGWIYQKPLLHKKSISYFL